MKIFVKAKPGAKEEQVEKIDPPAGRAGETHFVVAVREPPVQGRANLAIVKALADYFGVAPTRVRIISGYTARQKVVEIFIA
ncbi:DUF167 domain-containing protein [Candidatus Uhrbacteria bacterium]|nr:DUF167 domain-containing protein [Candidatus Uhrbacteria bacterium]